MNQQSHLAFTTRNHALQKNFSGIKRVQKKMKNLSRQESAEDVSKQDIIMANQISNDSLLSKTDIFESQNASKIPLPPKFNAANPFAPMEKNSEFLK